MTLAQEFGGIPPHQNKETKKSKGMEAQELGPWKRLVSTQLEKLIGGGRITSQASIADLRQCAAMLLEEEPTPFQWDTTMYTNYARNMDLRSSATPEIEEAKQEHHEEGSLEEAMLAQEGLNEEDAKGILKPTYVLGDIYLIRLERPPFFGFARWRGKRYSKKFWVFWVVCTKQYKIMSG